MNIGAALGGEPLQGDKKANGTYGVYVRGTGMVAERMFATYIYGQWTHPYSDQKFRHEILGRVGPLPPLVMENWRL